jgi:hypothetical protein
MHASEVTSQPAAPSAGEKSILWLIIVALALAITIPYLWVYSKTPQGSQFTWLLSLANDQNVYLSWAKQASEGHFFFRNLYTTELAGSSAPVHFNQILSLLSGSLCRITGLPLVFPYHLVRVTFAVLTLIWVHAISRELTANSRVRLLAVALVAFSGGIGWILAAVSPIAGLDVPGGSMKTEAFTFPSAFGFHFGIAAMALACAGFLPILRAIRTGHAKHALGAGLCFMLAGNTHPYNCVPIVAVLIALAVDFRPKDKSIQGGIAFAAAMTCLPLLHYFLVSKSSPDFQLRANYIIPAPDILAFITTYGPLLPLALLGLWQHREQLPARLLGYWLAAHALLTYLPLSFSGKFIEGVHLPLCILAALGLNAALKNVKHPVGLAVAAALLAFMSVSSVKYVTHIVQGAYKSRLDVTYFVLAPSTLKTDDIAALDFLNREKSAQESPVVLALPFLSNYIPARTGMYVYAGHWSETLSYESKLDEVTSFYFSPRSKSDAIRWLHEKKITYVVEGSYEKELAAAAHVKLPSQRLQLPRAFQSGQTAVYGVPAH